MLFSTHNNSLTINIFQNLSELIGHLRSGEPLVIPYREGYIIFRIDKVICTKSHTEIVANILQKYGELESIITNKSLIFRSKKSLA